MILIASDHAGVELKQHLVDHLESRGMACRDLGPHEAVSVDYPDFAHDLATPGRWPGAPQFHGIEYRIGDKEIWNEHSNYVSVRWLIGVCDERL